jgi:hypothetical protein
MSSSIRLPFHPLHTLYVASFSLLTTLCLTVPARSAINETVTTADGLAQLEQRASQAKPREQCFLYTEIVHAMTEQAGRELSDGEDEQAASTFKQINHYAHLIQMNMAKDTKRLKDAQVLLHHTTYKLAQYLHLVSDDDQQNVKDTLKQLDQINDQLLTQVFQR